MKRRVIIILGETGVVFPQFPWFFRKVIWPGRTLLIDFADPDAYGLAKDSE